MKNLFLISVLLFLISEKNVLAADLLGKVALQGETFNFELSGQKNWDYDIKRVKDKNQSKVQLYIRPIDQNFVDKIKNIENPYVKSIQVITNSIDGKTLVEFTLKSDQVETFDYLTDQPSKLIVDFYQAEATDESDLKTEKIKSKVTPLPKKKNANNSNVLKSNLAGRKSKNNREPADVDILRIDEPGGIETSIISQAGLYDGGDTQFGRFMMKESEYKEEAVIRSQNNYYLKFPILESEFTFWKKMKENPPIYEFSVKKDEENKQARLLKILFEKKRFLVFKQTFEWFKNKYPNSEYLEPLSFMLGDALIELWSEPQQVAQVNQVDVKPEDKNDTIYEQAQAAYMQALQQYPNSHLAERTSLLTGMLAIDKQDYMSAVRHLSAHAENKKYENKVSVQYAKIGLAYSLSKINKLEEALSILDKLEKQSKDPLVLADASVRKGDFYVNAKKYNEAVQAYDSAVKKYPIVSSLFPSAFFNKMEAQFWNKKFKDSHQSALEFTKNFPAHTYAPYALTRVGELLDIMGASQEKSIGAFLETHFRYGENPKTIVARLHLLSARMKSMKTEELDETIKKMDSLSEKSDLANVDQFKVTMLSDGFARRKEYRQAINILSKFYQQNPTRLDSQQVTLRIIRNINDELKNLSDKKDYKNLLKTYKEYADSWLKSQNRIDTDYLLGLAYENAGAYNVSAEKFNKTLKKMLDIKGTAREREVSVIEYLPTLDSLYLKISQNAFEAKSYQESYQALEKIKNPLQLSEEEQVSRVTLASNLYEQKGDIDTAIRYLNELNRLWKGSTDLLIQPLLKLSELQTKKNSISDALKSYQKAFDILMAQDSAELRSINELSRSYADLLIKQNKSDDAVMILSQIVNKFGDKLLLPEQKYLLGDLYFKKGEIKKAEQSWDLLKGNESDIWKKLAQEKLKQSAWDEDYKKHIKRIPAMSQLEGSK